MTTSVVIRLKSGSEIKISNLKYILNSNKHKETNFENFYLYSSLFTFVGESRIISLNSESIEFVLFDTNSND